MPPYTEHGHSTSGTTAARPTNCEIGFRYFDTDLQQLVIWNGTAYLAAASSVPVSAVAALGSDQAGAAALSAGFNLVSAADGTKGVRLPVGVAGMKVNVKNNVSGQTLKVYPETGGAINAVAANGAYSMLSLTACTFRCSAALQWYTEPLVAS
jgi:hypothetical protein